MNKILESPKCFNCNINLEQYYTYCEMCNKHFCLNCLFIHKYHEKMKNGNYQLKDIKFDKNHTEKKKKMVILKLKMKDIMELIY